MYVTELILLTFLALSCCAQEQLTCLRSPASPTRSSIFNNGDVARERFQGSPGKKGPAGANGALGEKGTRGENGLKGEKGVRGAKGARGARGTRGRKGQKGDSSTLDNSAEFRAFRTGFQRLHNEWIGLFNGYQYKRLNTTQNYTESRQLCKWMGSDLAVYGVQDMGNRRIIKNALEPETSMYIGLNDRMVERRWKWINGDLASDAVALWERGKPNIRKGLDCAVMRSANMLSYGVPCNWSYDALCEKTWD